MEIISFVPQRLKFKEIIERVNSDNLSSYKLSDELINEKCLNI